MLFSKLASFLEKVPLPSCGLALGLAALGNLLTRYLPFAHELCGLAAFALIGLVSLKYILHPHYLRIDLENSILASVAPTYFMTIMQLSGYISPYFYEIALGIWIAACISQVLYMLWFAKNFIFKLRLAEVFPTYFIAFVGIIVASVTSVPFGLTALGEAIFLAGFILYIPAFVLVTYRFFKLEIPRAAEPLFCIYAAPMSLSLAGYLSVAQHPSIPFAILLEVLAQVLLLVVLIRVPKLLRLDFYPSFAAMTFPFVISAIALMKCIDLFSTLEFAYLSYLEGLLIIESLIAVLMVLFVLLKYLQFFASIIGSSQEEVCTS